MRKIIKIEIIILLLALSGTMTLGCRKEEIPATAENPFALVSLGIRPEGDKIAERDINVEGADAIALAVELYELACQNDKNTTYRASFGKCPTSNFAAGMDNKLIITNLEIKNNNEYYRIDYRLKEDIPLYNNLPPAIQEAFNNQIELVTSERKYANTDMNYTRYQYITNASFDENGVPYADWSGEKEELTDPANYSSRPLIFSASQEGKYRKSEFIIEADTITTADIIYDSIAGIYTVSMELDCAIDENGYNKATEITRPIIQQGSGEDNAKYDSVAIEFIMWDNGYFKEFKSSEFWSAKLNFIGFEIDVNSKFLYDDIYSYDIADCNISKYYAEGNFID